ncbi:hypothetical protein [Xanthomonas sp. 3058]|uniref:hypothetical protein n=1 Tax=Xanthomonas sp. 3058 TaxID=3035314 RepID=UPI0016158DA8|nr:hypothetical protein [Xanthomonas sp. 3058]MBB5862757.1 hypothetical protein [Xanthomonas sp. 3058]
MAYFNEGQTRIAPESLASLDGHLRAARRFIHLHAAKTIALQHWAGLATLRCGLDELQARHVQQMGGLNGADRASSPLACFRSW